MGHFKLLVITILCAMTVSAHTIEPKKTGYPSDAWAKDLKYWFSTPPKGYGNVPFYWWNGDSLTHERLQAQLDLLSDASTEGFAVSYIHTHPEVDYEVNSHGYGSYGRPDPGLPRIFSEEWWNIWNWFSGECAKKGLGLGLDDYVVGWNGNGYYVDSIVTESDIRNYQGRLHIEKYCVNDILKSSEVNAKDNVIAIISYPSGTCLKYNNTGRLSISDISESDSVVYVISTTPSYELHPDFGNRLINSYFGQFESRLDNKGRQGLNYFFQDELHHELNILSWCEDMQEQFIKRKGYDVIPLLPALTDYIGSITPKVRMDYAEVVTQLVEERYLKPVYDWHNQRGLIYGSDNNGRGLKPTQYLDYFRVNSWYTAPGNETPGRGWSYRQTKVSSSIAHIYNRPRTWLEAFHSMGWDSNGKWLKPQLDRHLIAGGNLLCLHGLYYSTHGGWWEWAPPCFHFRMPYWKHMKHWLRYAERMCFLLSQGVHVCDIAVLYPTESLQAYPESSLDRLWSLTDKLANTAHDFDFIDYQSLQNSKVEKNKIIIGQESYKAIIIPDMHAIHHESLVKIREFYKKGGIVIAYGDLPIATTLTGENDRSEQKIMQQIFNSQVKNSLHTDSLSRVMSFIDSKIKPDFTSTSGKGTVLHRKIGEHEIYMVMNVESGDTMTFRQVGKVERWNAHSGETEEMAIISQSDSETKILCDHNGPESSSLYVFSPGVPIKTISARKKNLIKELTLDGLWNIKVIPTMDNKWGDFRLPATPDTIGVEARGFKFQYMENVSGDLQSVPELSSAEKSIYGYGTYMLTDTLSGTKDIDDFFRNDSACRNWRPYCFSWQYGVFDNPGSQGFHGLKGKVDNRIIILDKGCHQFFKTNIVVKDDGKFKVITEGVLPDRIIIDNNQVSLTDTLFLTKGCHEMLIAYANTTKGEYELSTKRSRSLDSRNRSMVMIYSVSIPIPQDRSPYEPIVATKWFGTSFADYSPYDNWNGMWIYEFEAVPGARSISFTADGLIKQIWIDGMELPQTAMSCDSMSNYTIVLPECRDRVPVVTISAVVNDNAPGTAFFVTPVSIDTDGGQIETGDWSDIGAFRYYSGGMRYSRTFSIDAVSKDMQMLLSLGDVDATCEVFINGASCGILLNPPYELDVSSFIQNGENLIEVEVYSTLSNHYQTIPSAYRGTPKAGLIGPVSIMILK